MEITSVKYKISIIGRITKDRDSFALLIFVPELGRPRHLIVAGGLLGIGFCPRNSD